MTVPNYWMNETTGVLRPAVVAYLQGDEMTSEHILSMRAYLRQWMAGDWFGDCEKLTNAIDQIIDRSSLDKWLRDAEQMGIDPL